jgi:two-component system, NarL family, nitrate/nitrite response regulator NarL
MARGRRVLLVGDDPLALSGLARLLSEETSDWLPVESLGEMTDPVDGESDTDTDPVAALVDLGAESHTDTEIVSSISRRYPVVALVAAGVSSRAVLAAGARGVVSRRATAARLVRALDAVFEGLIVLDEDLAEDALRPPARGLATDEELTPREKEVLELLALGLSNREIATRLGISFHTVKFHVNSILGKLGAASRAEVVAIAARAGLLTF